MKPLRPSLRTAVAAIAISCATFNGVAQATVAYQPGLTPFSFASAPGALPKTVRPTRSVVHFELDPYAETFSGTVRHSIAVSEPVSQVVLHAHGLTLGQAALTGSNAPIAASANVAAQSVTLTISGGLAAGNHEITLPFTGKLGDMGYGLYYTKYRQADGSEKRMLVTQMEPIGAREMLPLFDEPAFRTVWQVSITTDAKFTALSNMPVAKEAITGGKRRTDFAPTPSMSSYLLALAVGEFEKTTDTFDNTDLAIYTVAGKHHNVSYAMDATKRVLAYYRDYFGSAYPLPKLDQIAVPGKRGAMENWGLITYSEDALIVDPVRASYSQKFWSFNVIAHEIAHQWFGNLVTMAWWDGLWLNESFAEWMGNKATGALNPQWDLTASRAEARSRAMAVDALSNTLPIERALLRDQNSDDLFDAISYQKGHSVLNMVERFAGEAPWRDGLRDYLRSHAYSNATSADLWAAINRHTGADVQAFATAWTRQSGFPLLKALATCSNGKTGTTGAAGQAGQAGQQTVTLTQSRFALKPGYVPQQTWNLAVLVSLPGKPDTMKQTVFVNALQPKAVAAGRCGDAVLIDVGASGYYRVSYDGALQRALARQGSRLAAADRLRILSDAWALAEAGVAPPERAFDLMSATAATDPPELWTELINVYARIDQLLRAGVVLGDAHAHARRTLGRAFAHLGFTPRSGETDATQALRGELIAALGAYGDTTVLAESRKRVAAFINGTQATERTTDDVLNGALRAVGARASAADLQQLVALIASGKYPALEWPLATAISSARDPAVAKLALALSISDTLPRSVGQRLVGNVARNGLHDELAWQFTQNNLQALLDRNSTRGRPYVIAAPLQNSRNPQLAAAVKALAETTLEPDGRSTVLRDVASVARNAWAYEAVRNKLGFLAGPRNRGSGQ